MSTEFARLTDHVFEGDDNGHNVLYDVSLHHLTDQRLLGCVYYSCCHLLFVLGYFILRFRPHRRQFNFL